MRHAVADALNLRCKLMSLSVESSPFFSINRSRLTLDCRRLEKTASYVSFYQKRKCLQLPVADFSRYQEVWLEIGAGSGSFFLEMAKRRPNNLLIAVELDRMRAKSLLKRSNKLQLENLIACRGNIVPTLIQGIPEKSLDRIYILYPCPWSKTSQRRHRWYLHPAMAYLARSLKVGGRIIWASDQEFYVNEARFVCETFYSLHTLAHGRLRPNAYNDLDTLPEGRTKFESVFLKKDHPCFELIVQKN